VRADTPRVLGQQPGVLRRVVHAVDHGVFKGNAPTGRFIIPGAGVNERRHAAAVVGRHDLRAGGIVRRVQGDRQRQLQVARRQIVKALDEAARGQRNVAHADVFPVRVVDQRKKAHDIVKVIERLADAHEDDVGDLAAGLPLGIEHLVEHFRRLKIADQAADRRRAERAPLPAADLRGDADRIAVLVVHDDGLDGIAVAELPEIFDRPVDG